MRFLEWNVSPWVIGLGASFLVLAAALSAGFAWLWKRSRDRAAELERILQNVRRRDEATGSRDDPRSREGRGTPWRLDRGPVGRPLEALGPAAPSSPSPEPIPTLISIPCLEAQSPEDASQARDSISRRHAAIWQLADSGLSPGAIATMTGQPVGQVELILALRRKVRAASPESPRDPRS